MDDLTTPLKYTLGSVAVLALAVFVCAPSLYGVLWRMAKDMGFVRTNKKN